MGKTFPYYEPQQGLFKPWVPVRLGYAHKVLPHPMLALIDSGSDACFCSEDVAKQLGVKINKKKAEKRTFTAANHGQFDGYKVNLKLYFCGEEYNCPFFLVQTTPGSTPILLGHEGFFDHFKVTFDYPNTEMFITPLREIN